MSYIFLGIVRWRGVESEGWMGFAGEVYMPSLPLDRLGEERVDVHIVDMALLNPNIVVLPRHISNAQNHARKSSERYAIQVPHKDIPRSKRNRHGSDCEIDLYLYRGPTH